MNKRTFRAAWQASIPVLAGFTFLGISYGWLMKSAGFSFIYPFLMSIFVFAGSMQFVAVNVMLSAFNPVYAFILTLMVNARHLFYGISLLPKYKNLGIKKFYMIFALCDETFAINSGAEIPEGVDENYFRFFVSALDQAYWVIGTTLGVLLGSLIHINTKGIEFVMTALFVVIMVNQWEQDKNHRPVIIGVICAAVSLLIFKQDNFMIPAMIAIIVCFVFGFKNEKKKADQEEVAVTDGQESDSEKEVAS